MNRLQRFLGFNYNYKIECIGEPLQVGRGEWEYTVKLKEKWLGWKSYNLYKIKIR